MPNIDRTECASRDSKDPLRHCRERFTLPEDITYLDGNSLGPLPKSALEAISKAVTGAWGEGLISSWNDAGWINLSAKAGDLLAPLIGAKSSEVVFGDSTSVNLFKLAAGILGASEGRKKSSPKPPIFQPTAISWKVWSGCSATATNWCGSKWKT